MKLLRFFQGIILLSVLIFFSACHSNSRKGEKNLPTSDNHVAVNYAQGFTVEELSDYTQLTVISPWVKNSVYARYYLVKSNNIQTPADGIKVLIPIKTIATASVTHYEFLNLLGEINTITGICQQNIIYNPTIKAGVNSGKIIDLGDAFHINLEKVLELRPSALMMSGYNQNDPNAQRISQAGVPVIYNNEWMETTLLGRAEWIKFVAAFYDKNKLADSIFSEIENRYNDIKNKAAKVINKPNIMAGSNFRGTWYMPAGHSFMGQLFADAGTRYFYANDTTTGSLPLNVETVLKNFSQTDVWLNCNYASIDELLKADPKHALFNPVKNNRVYNFNKRMLPSGANDFWESAIARPDLILSDVIAILHPEVLPNYQLFYAEKLK
ncbi:MAG: periplasmic binding protein [Bacteroidetes bacterium]|nr:periplasmic binding protein [Bacteroidota bacterium]